VGAFLVQSYVRHGEIARASVVLESVVASDPSDLRARLALADALWAQSQHAEARHHYETVLSARPDHPRADAIRERLAEGPVD
jgi:Tfp pilus assembly protein PilF